MDNDEEIVYNRKKVFFLVRWYKKVLVWWKFRKLIKDDPFVYEDE